MFSSTFSTDDQNTKFREYVDENTKYIVPLDAIDLAYLPLAARSTYGHKDITVPLWKQSNDMYFEFEVLQVDKDTEPAAKFTKPDEEKLNLNTYLKIIRALTKTPTTLKLTSFDEDTIVIQVQNKKVYVSVNNFHGYVKSGRETLCRVCRVVTGQRDTHMLSEKHMAIVSGYISDVNCIRKVDQLWSHCILCNEVIENTEFHLTCSSAHELRLRDALCSTPVSNDKKHHGTGTNQAVTQSHVNGLPMLNIAQNNNVVSSYNTARMTNNQQNNHFVSSYNTARMTNNQQNNHFVSSYNTARMTNNQESPVNNVVSSWARMSNNTNNRQSNFSMPETPKNNTKPNPVTLKPGMAYCDVCDRIMNSNTLTGHQRGNAHKSKLQMCKNKQENEAIKAISNNVSPKPAENFSYNSNVCVCGTVFRTIYHERTHFCGKTHQEYLDKQKIEEETAKKVAVNDKIVNAGTSKNQNSSEICVCGIKFLLINKRTHYFSQHHREYVEKQNMKAENDKIAKAGTSNDTTLSKNQNNTTKEKPYRTLPDRQVFCNACNFKMHENNLQSHLKGRNHAENAIAKGIKIGQYTENNSFKAVQNTENNSFKTVLNTENNSSKAVQNTENNSFKTVQNNPAENIQFPFNKVVEKDIESNTKQLVFYNSKYTLTDCSEKNKDSSMQTKRQVDPETSNAVETEKSNVNENPSGKENTLVLKQADEATKQKTEVLKEQTFDKTDLEQKQKAIDEKVRNLVAKKRDIEIKDPYKIETVLFTNIPGSKVDVKPTNTGKSVSFGEKQEQSNKEQDINEKIRNLIERKNNIEIKEKRNDDSLKNKNNVEEQLEINSDNPKIESKLQPNIIIAERIKNLVSRKVDIDTVTKSEYLSNTRKHVIANYVVEKPTRSEQNSQELDTEKETSVKKNIAENLEKPVVFQKTRALENETNRKPLNTIEYVNLDLNSEQAVDNTNITAALQNITETMQKDTEITQKDTEMTHEDTVITLKETEMAQNDTEMTETGKKMTPELNKQPEMESAKESSLKKRNSFTDKIRNLVTRTRVRNKNDTSHVDERLSISISISETEISEETEPVKKQDKKLDLATRLRNFVARERAKRKNANSEENK